MKITRIKALCKAALRAMIYNDGGRQYLGTGEAAYPADNVGLGKTSIPTLFDMPDALSDMTVEEMDMEYSGLMPTARLDGIAFERSGLLVPAMAITYLDEPLLALTGNESREVLFVRRAYIDAAEKTEGYQMFHRQKNAHGEPLVVLSDGMMVTGIVRPIPHRTAESLMALMRGLAGLIPIGSPDPGVIEQEGGQVPGQMNIDDLLEEREQDDDRAGG